MIQHKQLFRMIKQKHSLLTVLTTKKIEIGSVSLIVNPQEIAL